MSQVLAISISLLIVGVVSLIAYSIFSLRKNSLSTTTRSSSNNDSSSNNSSISSMTKSRDPAWLKEMKSDMEKGVVTEDDVIPTDEFTAGSFKNDEGLLITDDMSISLMFDGITNNDCSPQKTPKLKAWGVVKKVQPSQVYIEWQQLQYTEAKNFESCTWSRERGEEMDLNYLGKDSDSNPSVTTNLKSILPLNEAKKVRKEDTPKRAGIVPQSCCWNNNLINCLKDSDCIAGGEGCISSGIKTEKYGPAKCNTCKSQNKLYDSATNSCKEKPPPEAPVITFFNLKPGGLQGKELSKSNHREIEGCLKVCKSNNNCRFVTYESNGGTCVEQDFLNDASTSGYVYVAPGSFIHLPGAKLDGYDIKGLQHNNIGDCKKECENTPNCDFFISRGNECWLKKVDAGQSNKMTGIKIKY